DELDRLFLVLDETEHEALVVVVGPLVREMIDRGILIRSPQGLVLHRADVTTQGRQLFLQNRLVLCGLDFGRLRHDQLRQRVMNLGVGTWLLVGTVRDQPPPPTGFPALPRVQWERYAARGGDHT